MPQRIVVLVREHPNGLSPAEARQLLRVDKPLIHTMAGMARDGLLRHLGRGKYGAL